MQVNLRVYERQAQSAYAQGADILVFPEDGLYGVGRFTRDSIEPFLEYIPDPKYVTWNPCLEPNRFTNTEVQRTLSCMARRYNFYLVANIGDRQPCVNTISHSDTQQQACVRCPPDGRLQHNTNVVYSPNGTLVARYHKYNLYAEDHFDAPATPEYIFFDTPFGRIGTVTCFDILFAHPTIRLIEQFSIDTLVYPTAWIDALPLWPAIPLHSGFGIGMSVNVLSSNIHWPWTYKIGGSGVFLSSGNVSYYRDPLSTFGELVMARVPTNANRMNGPLPTINELPQNQRLYHLPAAHKLNKSSGSTTETFPQIEFHACINSNVFTLIWLERNMTQREVCQGNVCCALSYEFSNPTSQQMLGQGTERYALGAFDGIEIFSIFGQAYLQVCMVTKCAGVSPESCGQYVITTHTKFDHMTLSAQFNTSYVYPGVSISRDGNLSPAPDGTWRYDKNTKTLVSDGGFQFPLLTTTLLGRWYERD